MNAQTNGYHFRPLPGAQPWPEDWRALDRAVARWVRIHGGSPLLARVAGWASLAEGNGDSALPLAGGHHGMPPLSADERAALAGEALVGNGSEKVHSDPGFDTPFVVSGEFFYLRRNYLHECAVAAAIAGRLEPPASAPGEAVDAALDALFNGDAGDDVQPQRRAVAQVLGKRLFVLTGGPGTGKTTTVLRMLLMLARDRAARREREPVIRLGAPTGKAAQRLSQSLREGAERLRADPEQPLPADWQPQLDCALRAEASTLHRLLGSRGHSGFRFHRDNRLPADIVVVDEASMIDLALLRALLDALPADATLVLVGDADQLTSVATGSVLLDLVGALEAQDSPALVRLQHCFRADVSLVPVNAAILAGDAAAFADAWRGAGTAATRREVASQAALRAALEQWCGRLRQLLRDAGAFAPVPAQRHDLVLKALDALRQRQLLCALRETDFGSVEVNARIEQRLRGSGDDVADFAGDDGDTTWYAGRAVMITRNDYAAGLFNGDVGLCLADEDGQLGVWFEATAAAGSTGASTAGTNDASHGGARRAVRFAPGSLPEHQGAFAVTIHKSQGSEYQHVALLLPPDADNRILSRQLLYTGASRARRAIELWGGDDALNAALATPVHRASGLAARLRPAPPLL
ncbi:MAG TPA: exodeoxyribonuclease V subunit alpha [Rhodanobacteraceae bacterium]|nr:exodeoxyribonuclease V subunit alpha [Rhodanobacteraceae bacterium]